MASIQSLGVGSGLLTSDLVDNIVSAERDLTDLRIGAERAEVDAKLSAIALARGALDSLQVAVESLTAPSTFTASTVTTSSPQTLAVTASSVAEAGVHTVEVEQLARSQTLISQRYEDVNAAVGTGTLTFRFGETDYSDDTYNSFTVNEDRAGGEVTIDASNNSLAGVRDAVNQAGIGVRASLVNDGEGIRLVFASDATGADNSIEVSVAEGDEAGLSALAFNASAADPNSNLSQTVAASDAAFSVDGVSITRDSNSASGVVDGLTFNLLDAAPGTTVTVSIARDTAAAVERVQSFVDAFNDVRQVNTDLTAFDAENQQGALLTGDPTLRNIMTQIRRGMNTAVANLPFGSAQSLSDIGITTNQNDNFKLRFDSDKLVAAINNNADGVTGLLAKTASVDDSLLSVVSFSDRTQAGQYAVSVGRQASQAEAIGQTVVGLSGGVTIDEDNDEIIVRINDTTTESLNLTHGTYADGAAIALELQNQINADENLRSAGLVIAVDFDSTNERLTITSPTLGSGSKVGIVATDTNTSSTLGLELINADFNKGLDVQGSINGVRASGSGQILLSPSGSSVATAGAVFGTAVDPLYSALTVGVDELTFEIEVDGVQSESLSVAAGSYSDGSSLAAALTDAINGSTNLSANGRTATVTYDTTNRSFSIASGSTGTTSNVNITALSAATSSAFGFTVQDGIAGNAARTGDDPSALLQVRVLGGLLGERGPATVVRGVMEALSEVLNNVLSSNGLLSNRQEGLNNEIESLDEEQLSFDRRIDAVEARLRSQFAVADALISQLNNTSDFLTQQLDTLTRSLRGDD